MCIRDRFHPTAFSEAGAPRFLLSEALRGEGVEDDVEVGLEGGWGPGGPVGLGDHAGEFAEDVGAGGEGGEVEGPGFENFFGDAGLGDVVEDEDLVGVLVDEADGLGAVSYTHLSIRK